MSSYNLQCSRMGDTASRWLKDGQAGKVLASVSHAIYLVSEQGDLVWLADPGSPAHARAIQPAEPLPQVPAGAPYRIIGDGISFGSRERIDLAHARIWKPQTLPAASHLYPRVTARFFNFMASFLEGKSPTGFGRFIPCLLDAGETLSAPLSLDISDRRAWSSVEAIARHCRRRSPRRLMQAASRLVGLGEGLTPSGDDFLGGLFFCLHLIDRYHLRSSWIDTRELQVFLAACRTRTHPISLALLSDHIHGDGLEPLHRLARALLVDRSDAGLDLAARDLVAIGHSTGWSLLAGFTTGWLSLHTAGPGLPQPYCTIPHQG